MRWLMVVLGVLGCVSSVNASGTPYKLIVNESNATTRLESREVARIFLKRKREWNEGRPILPVDQSAASPTRGLFCREVLEMSLGEVRDYWTKIVLSGRDVPPPVQGGDANVMEFVRSQPGAIGYVSGEADLPSGVKAVEVVQ